MDLLLINEHDHSQAASDFQSSAQALGIVPSAAYGTHAHQLNEWGIGALPCVARIHDGRAVYQVSAIDKLGTFEADAQAAVEEYDAAKAAREALNGSEG